jgi:hypothetical protein
LLTLKLSKHPVIPRKVPPQAPDREEDNDFPLAQNAYAGKFDGKLLAIIDWAMEVVPENRPQTVEELQDALTALA